VIIGRCDDRLKAGAAIKPSVAVAAVAEARVINSRRRDIALPVHGRPDMK
jgi:hypothetical protein